MKLVVADTTPINYLILIGEIEVLFNLFSKVVLPAHVHQVELHGLKTPKMVREWADNLPAWVEVMKPTRLEPSTLDLGEMEAIALARELNAPVLLDEREARTEAKKQGVLVIGTLGVLELGDERGLLNLPAAVAKLRATNARISSELLDGAVLRSLQRRGLS